MSSRRRIFFKHCRPTDATKPLPARRYTTESGRFGVTLQAVSDVDHSHAGQAKNGNANASTAPAGTSIKDPWRRARLGLGALALISGVSTAAYMWLGLSLLDAFYQTIITIFTVGYTEVGIGTDQTAYRLVTICVIVAGTGVGFYTLGVAFEALVESRLSGLFGRMRMQRSIDQLNGHVIVCGWGQVGQAITDSISHEGKTVVVVDDSLDPAHLPDHLCVLGDATDDDVLRLAGIERAGSLVVALNSDADNLYVSLSARSLNPGVFIVARANSAEAEPKLHLAGANRVVNPHEIGGNRMAALVMSPNVAEFLDQVMTDPKLDIRLIELHVKEGDFLDRHSLASAGIRKSTGASVLALRRLDGQFIHNPDPHTTVYAGDVLIVLCTPDQHAKLLRLSGAADPGSD